MKKIITLLLFLTVATYIFGQGTWTQRAVSPASARYRSISFEVNGKCYMGTGSTGGGISQNHKDLWEYDVALNTWTQKADLTGRPRTNAVGASDGTYGYVGLGSDNNTILKDWWQYDPVANSWIQKAGFPGFPRFGAGSFSLQNLIFVGGGLDSLIPNQIHSDFYAYDPMSNTWSQKSGLPVGVSSPATFTIGDKGYFVTGALDGSVASTAQTSEYDATADAWTTKAPYAGGNTFSAVGFSLFGYGYVGTGFTGTLTDMMWRYDPTADDWTMETSFPTGIRQWAVSCVSGNRAFVGTGNSTSGILYNDWWEFLPAITEINNTTENSSLQVSFDQSNNHIIVNNAKGNENISVFSIEGKLILSKQLTIGNQKLEWFNKGTFMVNVNSEKKISTTKIFCGN